MHTYSKIFTLFSVFRNLNFTHRVPVTHSPVKTQSTQESGDRRKLEKSGHLRAIKFTMKKKWGKGDASI